MKKIAVWVICLINTGFAIGQEHPLGRFSFLIGEWSGTGSGFGNDSSKIESSSKYVMNGKYIEVLNDSKFDPTEKKPEGEPLTRSLRSSVPASTVYSVNRYEQFLCEE